MLLHPTSFIQSKWIQLYKLFMFFFFMSITDFWRLVRAEKKVISIIHIPVLWNSLLICSTLKAKPFTAHHIQPVKIDIFTFYVGILECSCGTTVYKGKIGKQGALHPYRFVSTLSPQRMTNGLLQALNDSESLKAPITFYFFSTFGDDLKPENGLAILWRWILRLIS